MEDSWIGILEMTEIVMIPRAPAPLSTQNAFSKHNQIRELLSKSLAPFKKD